jgi:hypothetical protein
MEERVGVREKRIWTGECYFVADLEREIDGK